jgi:hypothetical protein
MKLFYSFESDFSQLPVHYDDYLEGRTSSGLAFSRGSTGSLLSGVLGGYQEDIKEI